MKWIKASERLPDFDKYEIKPPYFVIQKDGQRTEMYYSGESSNTRWGTIVDEWLDESQASDKDKEMLGLVQDIERIGNESLIFEMDLKDAKQEIERLKGLIETEFKGVWIEDRFNSFIYAEYGETIATERANELWQQLKKKNKL